MRDIVAKWQNAKAFVLDIMFRGRCPGGPDRQNTAAAPTDNAIGHLSGGHLPRSCRDWVDEMSHSMRENKTACRQQRDTVLCGLIKNTGDTVGKTTKSTVQGGEDTRFAGGADTSAYCDVS